MRKIVVLLTLITLCNLVTAAQEKRFKRVEKFPAGQQTNSLIGSFFTGLKDYNVVQYTFDAPYEKVWPAVKRISERFAKVSGRPVIGLDEQNGRVQNGRINQDAMIGMGSGAWLDEIGIEATKLAPDKTRVTVIRKVVQKEFTGSSPWKTQWSNGKIENYLLTQIEDEIKNITLVSAEFANDAPPDPTKFEFGKYVNKENGTDYIDLKPDKTFYLQERGRGFTGKYEIAGDVITIMLAGGQAGRARRRGETFMDEEGKTWVRQGGIASSSVETKETPHAVPKKVELGQTAEQVEATLGKPEKIINLGPKTVYVYKDLKIIFMDGKVTDVQ